MDDSLDQDVALREIQASFAEHGQQHVADDEIADEADHLHDMGFGAGVPRAELEEEALLLLVRRKNAERAEQEATSAGNARSGCGRKDGRTNVDVEEPLASVPSLPRLPGEADPATVVLQTWAQSLQASISALHEVACNDRDKALGQDRSISLVVMKTTAVPGCKCVRCRWGYLDMDVMWVWWLQNPASKGLTGRAARQVKLDAQHKILYSVADSGMQRTGHTRGVGYPELLCDDDHCSVIIKHVGASMKKVRKQASYRDEVSACCRRVHDICDAMAAAGACDDPAFEPEALQNVWASTVPLGSTFLFIQLFTGIQGWATDYGPLMQELVCRPCIWIQTRAAGARRSA